MTYDGEDGRGCGESWRERALGRREGVREGVNGKRMVLLSGSILCSAAMYSFWDLFSCSIHLGM